MLINGGVFCTAGSGVTAGCCGGLTVIVLVSGFDRMTRLSEPHSPPGPSANPQLDLIPYLVHASSIKLYIFVVIIKIFS